MWGGGRPGVGGENDGYGDTSVEGLTDVRVYVSINAAGFNYWLAQCLRMRCYFNDLALVADGARAAVA